MARILVCTRGEDILGELGSLLNEGHPLVVVPSVADATCSLLLGHYDAVVLDLDEETPQRLEALPILGRLNPHVPTFAVYGRPSLEVEAAIRAAGIFTLIYRPIIPGDLLRRLAFTVRRPRRLGSGPPRLPAEAERHPVARIA